MQQNVSHPCGVFHPVPYLGTMSLPLLPSLSKAFQEEVRRYGGKSQSAPLNVIFSVKVIIFGMQITECQ